MTAPATAPVVARPLERSAVQAVVPPEIRAALPARLLKATRVWLVLLAAVAVWEAAVAACAIVDSCIGRIADAVLGADAASRAAGGPGALLGITADHGNADVMRDARGAVVTAHSLSPVPFLLAGSPVEGRALRPGVLADVTPTLLQLLGLAAAPGMTGRSLLEPA